jgi:hypothetical protein
MFTVNRLGLPAALESWLLLQERDRVVVLGSAEQDTSPELAVHKSIWILKPTCDKATDG